MTGAEGLHAAVVGGGPAGLMAAERLVCAGARVTVYDRMPSLGRKLLLAGRGGLNLTHSEPLDAFQHRYGQARDRLRAAIEGFPPDALRGWADDLGQDTFVGTSGRVFPRAMKASPLLRGWLARLRAQGVAIATRHTWTGWDEAGRLTFDTPSGQLTVAAGVAVLALGGASWPRMGSDGRWVDVLERAGVAVEPLAPSNCGFIVRWTPHVRDRFEGAPLKRIALSWNGHRVRGEAVVTSGGIEGGAVYALSGPLRDAVRRDGSAVLFIDLRPDAPSEDIAARLAGRPAKESLANRLRKAAGLAPVAVALLNEAAHRQGVILAQLDAADLAARIKSVPVELAGVAPIEGAISSAGGVRFDAVDDRFMLRARPGVFVAGEMLDWEAPTGGYLLQAAFATGNAAAAGALQWWGERGAPGAAAQP